MLKFAFSSLRKQFLLMKKVNRVKEIVLIKSVEFACTKICILEAKLLRIVDFCNKVLISGLPEQNLQRYVIL